MRSIILKSFFVVAVVFGFVMGAMAQRIIKGTVYNNGEPMSGVTVEAHKGTSAFTSFDGKYEVEADAKSKWIKFEFLGEIKKTEIAEDSPDVIDFYWDGKKPANAGAGEGGANNKSHDELIAAKNIDYMQTHSLYKGYYDNNDYESALPEWEKLYKNYPKSSINIYIQGIKMKKAFLDKAKTFEEKEKLLNEIMEIYDNRIAQFGQEGYVLGRKGVSWFDFYFHADDLSIEKRKEALKKGYEWVLSSTNLQKAETEKPVIVLLMNSTVRLFKLGELPKETVVLNYEKSSKLLNEISEKGKGATDEELKTAIEYVDNIFSVSGAADCEALIGIYETQFAQNAGDAEFIKGMLRKLGKAKCTESDLYNNATEKLYELEPSAEAAFNMARRNIKRDPAKAKEYYKQAMEQETDQELLATYYYEYAYFIFADHSYKEAVEYAKKALAINPKYCEVLMLIGDIYVAASSSFSSDDFVNKTIFWLAVDYYNRAARAGDDCVIDASQKAADHKKYFPAKEDVFFQGLEEGASYKIEGWINETTKVRF